MSIRDILTRLKPSPKPKPKSDDENGALYKSWGMILPLILGFAAGSLIISGIGYCLDALSGTNGQDDTAVTGAYSSASSGNERKGLEVFIASNPFKISPQKTETPPEPPKPEAEPPQEIDSGLEDVTLRGTLPGIGGWFDVKNDLKLVLVGKEIDSYKLHSVSYSEAVFMKNTKTVKKYIVYGPSAQPKKAEAPKPPAPSAPAPAPAQAPAGDIVAAVPGAQEGQVPSELVSNMVQNPFDELKRIRIRPNDKAGGLEVQWIQNDSLLKRLGVKRGDVIRSVNGIPFTNMGDIANSINSLMNSERFDVEVTRGGQNTALRYVVK